MFTISSIDKHWPNKKKKQDTQCFTLEVFVVFFCLCGVYKHCICLKRLFVFTHSSFITGIPFARVFSVRHQEATFWRKKERAAVPRDIGCMASGIVLPTTLFRRLRVALGHLIAQEGS